MNLKCSTRCTPISPSAAPTYFEPALVQVAGKTPSLIDRGVFVYNPATSVYPEARRLVPDEKSFLLVSLGTGHLTRPIPFDEAKTWEKCNGPCPF